MEQPSDFFLIINILYFIILIIYLHAFKYISIHLRLGDKFLETDKRFVQFKRDKRSYSEENIYNFIENNNDKNIIFFCDNYNYKSKIKKKYKKVIITGAEIGHTSLYNTTNKQVLDAVTEFYILSNSMLIYARLIPVSLICHQSLIMLNTCNRISNYINHRL